MLKIRIYKSTFIRIIGVITLLLNVTHTDAQIISVLSPTGTTKLYSDFKSAVEGADNGSFIYCSGNRNGFAVSSDYKIAKKVHIIGVGYRADLNPTMGPTFFDGNLRFVSGSDGSTITGIYLSGKIYIGDSGLGSIGHVVNNLLIQRCRFTQIEQIIPTSLVDIGGTGIRIIENVIDDGLDIKVVNAEVSNNIFTESLGTQIEYMRGGVIKNNIFLQTTSPSAFWNCSGISVINNIFVSGISDLAGSSWQFSNNIICTTSDVANNYSKMTRDKVFKVWEGYKGYSYTNDYSLLDASVGKNGGTDGSDVGIYGGKYIWKNGGLPYNPHIISSEVSPVANPDGTINLKINVSVDGK